MPARTLLFALALCGCVERPAGPPGLPDALPGYAASPVESGPSYQRRSYARGAARVTVTLARFPMDAAGWAEWARSSAAYPQAALDVPTGEGIGFYECAGATERCDLLVQLRSGVHLELRGSPEATRADADAVARGLPLRALAAGAR